MKRDRNKRHGTCQHCKLHPASRARQLCYACYLNPAIRELYPPSYSRTVDCLGGHADPATWTDALPGTAEHLDVLAARVQARVRLRHPLDLTFDAETNRRILERRRMVNQTQKELAS